MNYPQLAVQVLKKCKGYWPLTSTDEPQVLALAEALATEGITDPAIALGAVTMIAKTPFAAAADFRPNAAMLVQTAVTLRRERRDERERALPPPEPVVATPEHRAKCMSEIRAHLNRGQFGTMPL